MMWFLWLTISFCNTARTRDLLLPRLVCAAASVSATARPQTSLGQRPGNAPGNASQTQQGLNARFIPPPCAIHHPVTNDIARMNRAIGAQGCVCRLTWAVGPG